MYHFYKRHSQLAQRKGKIIATENLLKENIKILRLEDCFCCTYRVVPVFGLVGSCSLGVSKL